MEPAGTVFPGRVVQARFISPGPGSRSDDFAETGMKKFLILSALGLALASAPALAQRGGHGGGSHGGGGFHGGGGHGGGFHGGSGFHGGGGFRGGYHGGYRGGFYRGPSLRFGFGGYYPPYYGSLYAPYYYGYYGAPYDLYDDYYDYPPPPPPDYADAAPPPPPPSGPWRVTQAPGETDYELPDSVLFGLDSSRVTRNADTVLQEIADAARRQPDARLVVEGHTDTSGTAAHNSRLSQARADAVAAVLERQGVARGRIETEGLGETRLAVQTGDGVREPRNRRVVIRLIGGDGAAR